MGGVTLLRVTTDVTWTQPIYIYIYIVFSLNSITTQLLCMWKAYHHLRGIWFCKYYDPRWLKLFGFPDSEFVVAILLHIHPLN